LAGAAEIHCKVSWLLKRLGGWNGNRAASYVCVNPSDAGRDGEALLTSEGIVEGLILEVSHGTGGFCYDPLFYLPGLDISVKFAISRKCKGCPETICKGCHKTEHISPRMSANMD